MELLKIEHIKYGVELYKNYSTLDRSELGDDKIHQYGYSAIGNFDLDQVIDNCSEEVYKSYSKEFFSSTVHSSFKKIIINKDEKAVRLKTYETYYYRSIGQKFFRKTTLMHFLTFNYKTKRFYQGRFICWQIQNCCQGYRCFWE